MAIHPVVKGVMMEALMAAGRVGVKAGGRALDSALEDVGRVLNEGSRRVKKARTRLHRIEVEPDEEPEDDG